MTAKEKAKELVDKFEEKAIYEIDIITYGMDCAYEVQNWKEVAKQCALICVEEILESSPSLPILSDNGSYGSDIEESTKYWQEVKNQIQLL